MGIEHTRPSNNAKRRSRQQEWKRLHDTPAFELARACNIGIASASIVLPMSEVIATDPLEASVRIGDGHYRVRLERIDKITP